VRISVKLSQDEAESLRQTAQRLGVEPEQLARAVLTDLLGQPREEFQKASELVLRKNKELYRRLA